MEPIVLRILASRRHFQNLLHQTKLSLDILKLKLVLT